MLRLLAIAALAMTALGPSTAFGQNATFFTVTYIEVGPLLAKVGAAALRADRNTGRKNPGNVHLDVFENLDRPNQFVMLGAWTDKAAYDTYATSDHFLALNEKLKSMLVAPIDTRAHAAIAGSVAVAPDKSSRDAVVAITHVDVVPAQKDNAAAALKQLANASREHPGNLQFHVWQQTDRPNHFSVIEAWSSRGAYNVHQMRNETRDFSRARSTTTGCTGR
jgi:quinol monooxygenase YgiN